MFHSRTLQEKTRITEFHGQPEAWGIVMRTITAISKRFTCVTTFGRRIAVACDDGTVDIYDSITGVLRLSLGRAGPVQAIRGSPDGSTLFCAHKSPSITVWDMQTGGLIHTFFLEWNAEDITVSLKGNFLACELSNRSMEVWEVANRIEGAAIWTRSPVTHLCWLDPEERLAVSTKGVVDIWDIAAGTLLHSFPVGHTIHHTVYSQKFNRLAIITVGTPLVTSMTIINPQTATSTGSHPIHQDLSCFAFSHTAKELVCGMETHGLQIFNLQTQRWRCVEYADTMTSVSSLPNGTMAANFAGSGVQLLNLDEENTIPQQPTIPALTVDAFDEGRIIAILSTNRDRIVLLELATMSQLLKIPVQKTRKNSADRTRVLCASLDNRMAVCSFKERGTEFLKLWGFRGEHPKWSVEIDGRPSIGRISPSGAQLVTFFDVDTRTCICVWDARDGKLKAQLRDYRVDPLDITFDSETRFYSYHGAHRIPYVVSLSKSAPSSHSITRSGPVSFIRGSPGRCYDVDDTYEWVVSGSRRICWIPSGYIGSVSHSYCWAGCSLVMVGQDGTLKKLTFREPT